MKVRFGNPLVTKYLTEGIDAVTRNDDGLKGYNSSIKRGM
jgi:hypothetical protein